MLFLVIIHFFTFSHASEVPITLELLNKLNSTTLVNNNEVITSLNLKHDKRTKGFTLSNPYKPATRKWLRPSDKPIFRNGIADFVLTIIGKVKFYHQPIIHKWHKRTLASIKKEKVCGMKFESTEQEKYKLKTFNSLEAAESAGYFVTHQGHCGACSSLSDLAAYLKYRNLTGPARDCSVKMGINKIKKCYQDTLEFSNTCSELWSYNSKNTKKACMLICMKDYGLLNILQGKFPDTYQNPDGSLRPCILCDELRSVPAYTYGSGRTRRNSGIITALDRNPDELYPLDYNLYYDLFNIARP